MIVLRITRDDANKAAEECQTMAEAARREHQWNLAAECEKHAKLYEETAQSLELVDRSRQMLRQEELS